MSEHKARTGVTFSNSTYDVLKFVAQILLPGLGALYFALAQIWGLPNAEQVVGTIAAFDTFLGLVLGISSRKYAESGQKYDGEMVVEEDEYGDKKFNLNLPGDPYELDQKKEIVFKVVSASDLTN